MAKKKERTEDTALPEEQNNAPSEQAPAAGQQEAKPDAGANGPDARMKALEEEVSDLKDKLLRKQADFENFRKRMFRERDEAARYANAALLADVIGVVDDFERAIRSAEESRDFNALITGITMIEKQFVEMLENRWGLKRFASVGESFDPNRHEAVLRVEGPSDATPTVVEDFQKGYLLHERVLRPAKVKVMVPASGPSSGDAGASDGGPEALGDANPPGGN